MRMLNIALWHPSHLVKPSLPHIFTGRNEVVAKVIFLHLSVIHSVHRGGRGLPQCMMGYHPPGSRHPRSRHPPDQTPPGPGTPRPGTPPDQTPPRKQTPAYGLRAAGTHPTGMHSCLVWCLLSFFFNLNMKSLSLRSPLLSDPWFLNKFVQEL